MSRVADVPKNILTEDRIHPCKSLNSCFTFC